MILHLFRNVSINVRCSGVDFIVREYKAAHRPHCAHNSKPASPAHLVQWFRSCGVRAHPHTNSSSINYERVHAAVAAAATRRFATPAVPVTPPSRASQSQSRKNGIIKMQQKEELRFSRWYADADAVTKKWVAFIPGWENYFASGMWEGLCFSSNFRKLHSSGVFSGCVSFP